MLSSHGCVRLKSQVKCTPDILANGSCFSFTVSAKSVLTGEADRPRAGLGQGEFGILIGRRWDAGSQCNGSWSISSRSFHACSCILNPNTHIPLRGELFQNLASVYPQSKGGIGTRKQATQLFLATNVKGAKEWKLGGPPYQYRSCCMS
jgi:hypothetical protein